jgi:hypothetical protein
MSLDFIGGIFQAQAQEDANAKNLRGARETNVANLALNLTSRGAPIALDRFGRPIIPRSVEGSESAILPYYFGGAEKQLGQDALDNYNAIAKLYGAPELELQQYQAIIDKFGPAFQSNEQLASDIASGKISQDMLAESEPVFGARLDVAEARKNSGLEALKQTLNEIDAIQAKRGFLGEGYGKTLVNTEVRRRIFGEGADAISQAKLANAMEKRAVQESGRNLRLSNISLPDALARASLARRGLPASTIASRYGTSLAPFSFFNLGPHDFSQFQRPPQVDAATSPWALAAQTGAAAGSTVGNYFLQRDLQNRYMRERYRGGGGGGDNPNHDNTQPSDYSDAAYGSGEDVGGGVDYSAWAG